MKQTVSILSSVLLLTPSVALHAADAVEIGSRRELFVDHYLIDRFEGARLVLHRPQPRELVLKFDQPWEGLYSGYETILKDGDTFRFYYRGMPEAKHDLDTEVTCVAESNDGIHWNKPNLGIYEVRGTKENNVVLARSRGCHNLAPLIDAHPSCPADQRNRLQTHLPGGVHPAGVRSGELDVSSQLRRPRDRPDGREGVVAVRQTSLGLSHQSRAALHAPARRFCFRAWSL